MKKKHRSSAPAAALPVEPRPLPVRIIGWLLVLTAFLLPLKWGTLAAMTEAASFFPLDHLAYLHITWPAHTFGIWSGVLAILTVCLPASGLRNRNGSFVLFWGVIVILAALPGCFASGRDADFALGEFSNAAALGAWTLAVWQFTSVDRGFTPKIAGAFVAGVIITALNGYYQYFYGFAEMKDFVRQQLAQGLQIPEPIRLKLADTRINSFMASSNALSGILLITFPVMIHLARKLGKRVEPVSASIIFFISAGSAVLGGALLLCRSRSVILTLILSAVIACFTHPAIKKRYKVTAAVLAVLAVLAGAVFALKFGRGFGSITERADYLRTSAVLAAEHPLSGGGWGSFFYRHMQMKFSATDEAARDPHNAVAAFAGQSGIICGIAMLIFLLLPLVLLWKERFSGNWQCTVFWSGMFFTWHILMDCDFHIPAIMAAMAFLYASALHPAESPGQPLTEIPEKRFTPVQFVLLPLVALTAIYSNWLFLKGEWHFANFSEFLNPSDLAAKQHYAAYSMEEYRDKAAAARPSLALIPELAGDWYFRRGDLEQAAVSYQQSLKLNPRRPGIYRRLARLACAERDFDRGRKLLEQAAGLFPRNPKYRPEHPENQDMFNPETNSQL